MSPVKSVMRSALLASVPDVPHKDKVTKDFIARAKKRMTVANEQIRLAQDALQDAMDEKDHDMREVPLAETRPKRLQKEVVPPQSPQCPIWKPRFTSCEPN